MYRYKNIMHLQVALAVGCIGLGLLYFVFLHPVAQEVDSLDPRITSIWDRLFDINLRNRTRVGMDLASINESHRLAQKTLDSVRDASETARKRLCLEPEVQEVMQQPFQLLDYDRKRLQCIEEVKALGQQKKVALSPEALLAYPEYVVGNERPAFLWAQLAVVHHVLSTAVAQGPTLVKSSKMLPTRTHRGTEGDGQQWQEVPVRIELAGNMEAMVRVLTAMPLVGTEFKQFDLVEVSPTKPALFFDRMVLKVSTNANEVLLDAVVCGFIEGK